MEVRSRKKNPDFFEDEDHMEEKSKVLEPVDNDDGKERERIEVLEETATLGLFWSDWFDIVVHLSFFFAFASLLGQVRPLFGFDGLEPAHKFLLRFVRGNATGSSVSGAFSLLPTLIWFSGDLGVPVDVAMECVCVVGMAFALAGVFVGGNSGLYVLLWAMYGSVYALGGTFLSFQWDILLLETGIAAAIAAPLFPEFPLFRSRVGDGHSAVGLWLVRFLGFKLMLMSGLAKLSAKCPTWENLTALDFHFATQCLPTPLAYWAHQLPVPLLHWGTGLTLVIEGYGTWLLLVPGFGDFASFLTVVLMICIALTGNYNFFNLLTIGIVLPNFDPPRILPSFFRFQSQYLLAALFFAIATSYTLHPTLSPTLIDPKSLESNLASSIIPAILFAALFLLLSALHDLVSPFLTPSPYGPLAQLATAFLSLPRSLLAAAVFATSAFILSTAAPKGTIDKFPRMVWDLHHATHNLHLTAGYGLFRRMTGVGDYESGLVARPEVVFEVSVDGSTFFPLHHVHKPTSAYSKPTWAQPMAPRFDWQMWFAALGPYSSNPWLVHFADKVMEGSPDVLSLLNVQRYPFAGVSREDLQQRFADAKGAVRVKTASGERFLIPPKFIRAKKYLVDFVRENTTHAQSLEAISHRQHIINSSDSSQWWIFYSPETYLPTLRQGQLDLGKALADRGWERITPERRKAAILQRHICRFPKGAHLTPLLADTVTASTNSTLLQSIANTTAAFLPQLGPSLCQIANTIRPHLTHAFSLPNK